MRILIAGATGFIGRKLVIELLQNGHEVICISRNARVTLPLTSSISWTKLAQEIENNSCYTTIDAIINLSGEKIDGRWSKSKKQKILNSRIDSNKLLIKLASICNVKVLITSSAVGFYGDRGNTQLSEQDESENDFLASVCKHIEDLINSADINCRKVILRTGIVIGEEGGLMKKISPFLRMHLIPIFGKGDNYLSWISHIDVVRAISFILERPEIDGPVNLTSPKPISWRGIAKALNASPIFLPRIMAKLLLGEASQILLFSQRVLPQKLVDNGFVFTQKDFSLPLDIAPQ